MKKLFLILSLFSLTAQAMQIDEEAAIPLPPAGQEEDTTAEEVEPELEGRRREREILFCTNLCRRFFRCTENCADYFFEKPIKRILPPALIIATGYGFGVWYIIESSI